MQLLQDTRGIVRVYTTARPLVTKYNRARWLTIGVLILLWPLARPAMAQASSQGYSENDFFQLYWSYHLDEGWGRFSLLASPEYYNTHLTLAAFASGLPFDNIEPDRWGNNFEYIPYGEDYVYSAQDVYASQTWFTSYVVTFPADGVILRESQFAYMGYTHHAGEQIPITPNEMDFVTIAPVPEPAAVMMLGAGLAGLGLTARLRREQKIFGT